MDTTKTIQTRTLTVSEIRLYILKLEARRSFILIQLQLNDLNQMHRWRLLKLSYAYDRAIKYLVKVYNSNFSIAS